MGDKKKYQFDVSLVWGKGGSFYNASFDYFYSAVLKKGVDEMKMKIMHSIRMVKNNHHKRMPTGFIFSLCYC